ncbi:unnamed protein product [Dimorphilus gyrociliatus]|uniref:BTB domain-containing protein n=1 Tax=Dimorphilus gyrociliatus TaxID=2664684 RepID=A0A7I8VV86_9ANNE|nr:unnamed protein product [Dimorphilus gyrociliatus]
MASENVGEPFPPIVELNVGGVFYTTALSTLTKDGESLLGQIFTGKYKGSTIILKDNKGKYFLDRDGVLFRYILDFLRNGKLVLPENFQERERLKNEAEFFKIPAMVRYVQNSRGSTQLQSNGYITVSYRGTFAFGRDGLADVKFRKLSRILICGRVSACREIFGDTLNESRDPDRGGDDRYSSRFFLKHSYLEQAFDMLQEGGFKMVGSCGSGTNSAGEVKPGNDSEECKWNHYNEFVFCRN